MTATRKVKDEEEDKSTIYESWILIEAFTSTQAPPSKIGASTLNFS